MLYTKETIDIMSNLSTDDLTNLIREAGYKEDIFLASRFLGITNGGDFCYGVTYPDDGAVAETKVFVKRASGALAADY